MSQGQQNVKTQLETTMRWVVTADIFTKPLTVIPFTKHQNNITNNIHIMNENVDEDATVEEECQVSSECQHASGLFDGFIVDGLCYCGREQLNVVNSRGALED
jgi:hypothetical protein